MKKLLLWVFMLTFAVALTGCGRKTTNDNAGQDDSAGAAQGTDDYDGSEDDSGVELPIIDPFDGEE